MGKEEIRARAGVLNINEKIRNARLIWLGRVERNTEGLSPSHLSNRMDFG